MKATKEQIAEFIDTATIEQLRAAIQVAKFKPEIYSEEFVHVMELALRERVQR